MFGAYVRAWSASVLAPPFWDRGGGGVGLDVRRRFEFSVGLDVGLGVEFRVGLDVGLDVGSAFFSLNGVERG
jgi:hypothetical protein